MKRLFLNLTVIVLLPAVFAECKKDIILPEKPSLEFAGAKSGETADISEVSFIKVSVNAEGGVSSLSVEITSPTLDEEKMGEMGLATEFDLAAPGAIKDALKKYGLPCGDDVSGKTGLDLDLTFLLDALQENSKTTADHIFAVKVTDKSSQQASGKVTIHQEAASDIIVNSVDLWARTAEISIDGTLKDDDILRYRIEDETQWNTAGRAAGGKGAFLISPQWNEGLNDAGLTVYTIDNTCGFKANTTYELQLVDKDGNIRAELEYTTAAGDELPNNDFKAWYTRDGKEKGMPYPNAAPTLSPDGFWDSGNNTFKADLCTAANGGGARLKSGSALSVLTPGNLFAGDFSMSGMQGTVSFGKHFDWTARPSAIVVKFIAEIGFIDSEKHSSGHKGNQDEAAFLVSIVNWNAQHKTTSGPLAKPVGSFSPMEVNSVDEGPIIGYCGQYVAQSTGGITEITMPFYWYDPQANPADALYNISISISNSRYGDYLTGCKTNEMTIYSIEFIY